jgi:glycosyltransferase involved in cell wall biosynthesis
MNKKIYAEPLWKMHLGRYRAQTLYPPEGYEFIMPQTLSGKAFNIASKLSLSYSALNRLDRMIPLYLIKSHLERLKKIPEGTDLTYSFDHLVFRKEPWVVELETVANITSGSERLLRKYKGFIEGVFASKYCKKIIFWNDAGMKSVLLNLDCSKFERKIERVNLALPKRDFIKSYNRERIRLLFINSVNRSGLFHIKGGKEVLEAFAILNRKYNNIELVVQSADIPHYIKNKYEGIGNIRFIEKALPWELLEQEYKSADIYLAPGYTTPVWVILDAMSYELPIVATDVWCTPEFVEDGTTGLLVPKSEVLSNYPESLAWNTFSPQFRRAIRTVDTKVSQQLANKISMLIESEELRRRMGKAGRHEIEKGKFSIDERNRRLKKLFDEATLGEEESD